MRDNLVPWKVLDITGSRKTAEIPTSEGKAILKEMGKGTGKYMELTLVGPDGNQLPIQPPDPQKKTAAVYSLPISNGKALVNSLNKYRSLDAFGVELMKNALGQTQPVVEPTVNPAPPAQSGMIRVILNGQEGEIPESSWADFVKENPGAKRL